MGRRRRMVLGGVAVGTAMSLVVNARSECERFEARIAHEIDDLFAASTKARTEPLGEGELDGLPEPVRRWLRWSGAVGKPYPATVRLRQEGDLRLGSGGWFPFVAEEYLTTDPPGFVWSARMAMPPFATVIGRDRYSGGKASIEMRLLGIVPVARDSGPEIDHGALLRFLNETMWFPAGAISPYIAWEPGDGGSARATITHGGATATATFLFDRNGRVTDIVAERYDRDAGRALPWSTPITDHGEFDGVRMPVAGEGVYACGSGDFPYIRQRVTAVEYNRPERFPQGQR